MMNWTEEEGNARPYATKIVYYCPTKGWGFPESGDNETSSVCSKDGTWNVTVVSKCISKHTMLKKTA